MNPALPPQYLDAFDEWHRAASFFIDTVDACLAGDAVRCAQVAASQRMVTRAHVELVKIEAALAAGRAPA